MVEKDNLMEKIVSLCKRRGFVFQASEIYGGTGSVYDFGPLGVEMKNAIKRHWWATFVLRRRDMVGLDTAIIQHPKTWEASGHLKSFTDPLVECKKCHQRFRADHVKEAQKEAKAGDVKKLDDEKKRMVVCEKGEEHEFTTAKDFNLMFKTFIGPAEDTASVAYLRPETAQGIFSNFKTVLESSRVKIPFGIAQIGKAFRNEITPGNFIFRTREFEQAEIEFFVKNSKEESEIWYKYWIEQSEKFYTDLGLSKEKLRIRPHDQDELSHYSIGTSDVEYEFPFGMSELGGIAQRTDFDLSQHEKFSGKDLKYFDEATGEKFLPYVIEPSIGLDRAMLAFLVDGYSESDGTDGREAGEVVLKLNPTIAPVQVAVFPLVKKEKLPEIAEKIQVDLAEKRIRSYYDESGSIGRRYRRQDEIGTPWCVTVDFQTLEDQTVTIRDRDTLKQERIKIEDLKAYIFEKLNLS